MTLQSFFLPLIIGLGYYGFQIFPFFFNNSFGVDTWRYLYIAKKVREIKKIPESLPEKYLIVGPSDYPPVIILFLSFFSQKFLEKFHNFITPFFNVLASILTFLLSYFLTRNFYLALFAQIIFCSIPITAMESTSLNPRCLGSLFFATALSFVIIYNSSQNILWLVLAVFAFSVLLLTHKFANQAMTFLLLALAVIEKNYLYLMVWLLGFPAALLISRGFYLKVFRGHLAILKYWAKNAQDRYAHQVKDYQKEKIDFVNRINQIVNQWPVVVISLANLFILIIIYRFLISNYFSGWPVFLFKWIMILWAVSLITSYIRPLKFLGEGLRYLDYTGVPTAILTSIIFFQSPLFIKSIICLMLLINLGQLVIFYKKTIIDDNFRSVKEDLKAVFDYINSLPEPVNIATLPYSLADSTGYFTRAKILEADSSLKHPEYSIFFPKIRVPLEEIFQKYQINYCLINEDYVKPDDLGLPEASFQKIFQKGNFSLFKVA